jgi:hypothetical protein
MGTISGTTHIKTKFSAWTGTDKHFIGNALCSSGNCHLTLSHLHAFKLTNIFYGPPEEKNPEESNPENEGARDRTNFGFPGE